MAVQARIPDFRSRSNHSLHPNHLGRDFMSDPQSELTCNVSGSRKRGRYPEPAMANAGPPVQLPPRLAESAGASTSSLDPEIYKFLYQQNIDIDNIIRFHNERLRLEVEESRRKYCSYVISLMENGIMNRLREKELELELINQKNAELEAIVRQLSDENEIWFSIAKNSEATVSSLQSSLQQALLHSVDAVGPDAEDVQSCCIEGDDRRICRSCCGDDASAILLPCKHLCVCEGCAAKVDTCPICCRVKEACVQTNLQ